MILLLRSIFFKEFLKTRAGMALLCAGNLAFMTWLWLAIRRLFLQDHPAGPGSDPLRASGLPSPVQRPCLLLLPVPAGNA